MYGRRKYFQVENKIQEFTLYSITEFSRSENSVEEKVWQKGQVSGNLDKWHHGADIDVFEN